MRVGINGMGRIGRLALRAAMGGDVSARRTIRAPAIGSTSCTSTRSRAAPRSPRICLNSTACMAAGAKASAPRTIGRSSSATGASASAPRPCPGEVPWGDLGCDIVLECTGKFLKPDQLAGLFRRAACERVIVAAPVKDPAALNVVVGVNDDRYDPARAPAADRGVLHHQLPRAGGQGGARGDRHPPRPDHHDP